MSEVWCIQLGFDVWTIVVAMCQSSYRPETAKHASREWEWEEQTNFPQNYTYHSSLVPLSWKKTKT